MRSLTIAERPSRLKALDDAQLLSLAMGGESEAFGELYQRYVGPIFRHIYYRVSEKELAEDLTETVFLRVLETLPRFRPNQVPFKAWLYKVTHNLLVDHYRARGRRAHLEVKPWLADPGPSPEESLISNEKKSWLAAAIVQLKPEFQQVLALRFINDLSHAETSEILGRTEGAVRILQYRALKALRSLLEG